MTKNAANIVARFHRPTDTRDARWSLSWRGFRLGTVANATLIRNAGESARLDHALAAYAAKRLCDWHMAQHSDALVTAESVTVGDLGATAYSIHVVTVWN